MKRIPCPGLGLRPASEFLYGGEVRLPPPEDADERAWTEYVFHRSGAPGALMEWWHHRPSGRWLVLERDTLRDRILRVVPMEEVRHGVQ